jgi:hypothetical protein
MPSTLAVGYLMWRIDREPTGRTACERGEETQLVCRGRVVVDLSQVKFIDWTGNQRAAMIGWRR